MENTNSSRSTAFRNMMHQRAQEAKKAEKEKDEKKVEKRQPEKDIER